MNNLFPLTIPTPFAVGPVNVYLLDGSSPALVDVGPNTDEALDALREGLAAHGRALADIRYLVITHAHPDHFGLAARVVAESNALVYSHRFSVPRLTGERTAAGQRNEYLVQLLRGAGVPLSDMEAMRQDFHTASRFSRPITVDVAVEDHDELILGDSSWEVIHTPGHAPGHICLYHRPSGQLLSGDHLLRDISSNPVLEPPRPDETERPRSLVQYLHSLERVAALEAVVALPGHGAPIKDLRGLVAQRVAFHRRRAQEMMTLLVQGPRTAYQITNLLFTDLHGVNLFLGLSEVIGHLDILEDEGRIVAREGKIPVLYALAGD